MEDSRVPLHADGGDPASGWQEIECNIPHCISVNIRIDPTKPTYYICILYLSLSLPNEVLVVATRDMFMQGVDSLGFPKTALSESIDGTNSFVVPSALGRNDRSAEVRLDEFVRVSRMGLTQRDGIGVNQDSYAVPRTDAARRHIGFIFKELKCDQRREEPPDRKGYIVEAPLLGAVVTLLVSRQLLQPYEGSAP